MFQHYQGGNEKMKNTNIKITLVQERALNDGDMCQVYEVGNLLRFVLSDWWPHL